MKPTKWPVAQKYLSIVFCHKFPSALKDYAIFIFKYMIVGIFYANSNINKHETNFFKNSVTKNIINDRK